MKPVAEYLSKNYGVLEPLQTKDSISEQLQELKNILKEYSQLPVVLIGWSWGAWLSFIFAASYPYLVKKLILIGSGPFEEKYAAQIMTTRTDRLTSKEKEKLKALPMKQTGELFDKTDSYAPPREIKSY